MELEAAEATPLPYALVAVTVHVPAAPLVRPVTAMGLAVPVPVALPEEQVAVYPVMGDPPVLDGAVKATDADALPAVAVPIRGAPGGVAYVIAAGLTRTGLLLGVRVTGPTVVGVTVNVCGAADPLKVRAMGEVTPPPVGVMVMVPV